MSDDDTRAVLLKACADLGVGRGPIADATPLRGLMDPLDVIEVIMAAEEAFGISVDDARFDGANLADAAITFGDLVKFIQGERDKAGA